jgi:hypothetical protein
MCSRIHSMSAVESLPPEKQPICFKISPLAAPWKMEDRGEVAMRLPLDTCSRSGNSKTRHQSQSGNTAASFRGRNKQ